MKITFTRFKNMARYASGGLMLLLATLTGGSSASAQTYCTPNHYWGCAYNTNSYRYGAIEEVTFASNGSVIYSKTPDECNDRTTTTGSRQGHFNLINGGKPFDLSYGQEFSLFINGHNYTYYQDMIIGVWIDLNRDGDFDDADEFLLADKAPCAVNSQFQGTLPTPKEFKFTIPCGVSGTGVSRIRIRSGAGYSQAYSRTTACLSNSTSSPYYGETEDFEIRLSNPTTLKAGFFMPDTAYVKTPVQMVNTNQQGYFYHGWDIEDDGSINYQSVDASHKFTSTGQHCVRLYSENCLGRDSILKCVEIVSPTAPPVADFVSSSNKVEIYNSFTLTDLSTNGAIYWDWFMYQESDSAGTRIDGDVYADMRGGDETVNKNPSIFTAKGIPGFPDVGKWCIGLTASNDIGASQTVIKKDYVEVVKGCDVEMGPGTLTSIPGNVITCEAGSMISKTDGNGNYSRNESGLDALIAPCGATSITWSFAKWDVRAGVNLKVYDGPDATGTPLHPNNGYTSADDATKDTLVAKTGAMYFLWSSGAQTAEGFLGNWKAKVGTAAAPIADFDGPDTIYNGVWNTFTNTSQNAIGEVFYTWEVDGNVESNVKNMDYVSYSNKTYSVCLTVETCAGKNTNCKNVVNAPITSKTELDFTADNRRPKAGDNVQFTAMADKANSFKWTFFPSTSVTFVGGTSDADQNPMVAFSAPGKYTVSLKGWNNQTSTDSATSYAQVIKDQFVIVIDYCKPVIGVTTSSDIAIHNVTLEDNANPRNTLIDYTSTDEAAYTNFITETRPAELTFGGTYHVNIIRSTTANRVNRKVWVDFNIDGDFEDAGELVYSESPSMNATASGSFTVPDLKDAFEGATRMRVGISYNNDANEPCGANSGVSGANRIGEFEDYPLVLANDNTYPWIDMNGNDTVYVEVNGTYTDPGATAMDPTEGNITSRLQTRNDVDASAAGIYYVTYDVSDASGNAAPTATRVVVVVVDQTAPELTLKGADTVYVDVLTGTYTEPGWTATDITDGNLETAVVVTGNVNTFKIGTYELTYTVQDAQANVATATRYVIVRDLVFPTITNDEMYVAGGRNVVNVQLQSVFVDRTVPADNYSNGTFGPRFAYTITPSTAQGDADVDTRVKGTTVVTYTCTDESGNRTVLVIDYVVEDFIAPVITLNTLDTVYHNVNDPYTPVKASVSDNLYDNTQVSLTRTSNVNPFVLGLYTDTYTATDASGNVTVRNRWVRVQDQEAPVINSKVGPIVRIGLFSNVKLTDYLRFTDNYDAPSVLLNNVQVLANDVNWYKPGFYAAQFVTSDNSGNQSVMFTLYVEVSGQYETINSVENIEAGGLMKVYPNPSNGIFNVQVDLPSNEEVQVAVFDMMGNQVAEVTEGQMQKGTFTVDMTGKAAGMYFVRMSVNNQVFNQKVIVQ